MCGEDKTMYLVGSRAVHNDLWHGDGLLAIVSLKMAQKKILGLGGDGRQDPHPAFIGANLGHL